MKTNVQPLNAKTMPLPYQKCAFSTNKHCSQLNHIGKSQCGSYNYKTLVTTSGHSQMFFVHHIDYFKSHEFSRPKLIFLSCVCESELCIMVMVNHVSKPGTSPCAISTCPSFTGGLCWAIRPSYSKAAWATVSDLLFSLSSHLSHPNQYYSEWLIILWCVCVSQCPQPTLTTSRRPLNS